MSQLFTLAEAMRNRPISSIEARNELGVLNVTAVVSELRKRGYTILTTKTHATDGMGRGHYCAQYTLVAEPLPLRV